MLAHQKLQMATSASSPVAFGDFLHYLLPPFQLVTMEGNLMRRRGGDRGGDDINYVRTRAYRNVHVNPHKNLLTMRQRTRIKIHNENQRSMKKLPDCSCEAISMRVWCICIVDSFKLPLDYGSVVQLYTSYHFLQRAYIVLFVE